MSDGGMTNSDLEVMIKKVVEQNDKGNALAWAIGVTAVSLTALGIYAINQGGRAKAKFGDWFEFEAEANSKKES